MTTHVRHCIGKLIESEKGKTEEGVVETHLVESYRKGCLEGERKGASERDGVNICGYEENCITT